MILLQVKKKRKRITVSDNKDIKIKKLFVYNRKYIIDVTIHSEVDTNDIVKVQERFTSDCACAFAEAIREVVNINHLIKEQKENKKVRDIQEVYKSLIEK